MSGQQVGGTGVPPVLSDKVTRRHLPHWQIGGATYFLTWRCADGIILTEAERDIVLAAILHWDVDRWDVFAAVVMPDHVHVLACPRPKAEGRWDLSELLHSVKSYSAHQIAKQRKQREASGVLRLTSRQFFSIWQDERYDRWMRDKDELAEKWEYMVGNPVKAGLVQSAEQYRWLYRKMTDGTPAQPTAS